MDVKENLSKPIDSLSYWWWPGQWLRIVWAVWTDQLWYWQNVLPQLQGKRAASFFFQALFGGGLFGLVLATATGLIVETTGIHMVWRLWVAGFVIGIIVTAMVGGAATLFNGANWGVSASAIFGLLYPFNGSIIIGTIVHFPFPFTIFLLYGTVGGLLLGMSENIYKVIKQGKTLGAAMIIEELAIYMLVAGGLSRSVTVGVITGLAYLFGTRLGRIWATRQVPDEETRKMLATSINTENLF
jgi:hypothetical protein